MKSQFISFDGMHVELATQKEQQDAFPDENNLPQAPVNWKKGDLIGAGAFGRVYLGMNNDNGELIAIKQVDWLISQMSTVKWCACIEAPVNWNIMVCLLLMAKLI